MSHTNTTTTTTQVAIVGAGPAGLLLGALLHQAGIDHVIVERQSADYVLGRIRAGVLEPGTVALMDQLGIGQRMHAEGLRHQAFGVVVGGQHYRIDLGSIRDGYVQIYGQTELTRDVMAARQQWGLGTVYEAEEVQVMAEVLDDTSHPGRKALLGLLTGIYQAHGFRAYLWLAATHCATVLVNDLGNFAIDNLTPGDYSLVLSGPDMEIHLDHVPVHAH